MSFSLLCMSLIIVKCLIGNFFKIKNDSVKEIHLFKLNPSIRYRIKILRLDIMAKNTVIV